MKIFFLFFSFWMLVAGVSAQDVNKDTRYFEDQFYMGVTYNLLLDKAVGIEQRNLPYGLQLGYIKDIPVNKSRTFGFGMGFGYAVNNYYTNMLAENINSNILYSAIGNDVSFKRSKVETHLIEMPLELRWRTSTVDEYKFWRVYTGVKLGYAFSGTSKFVTKDDKNSFSNSDIRDFHYGLSLNFGYNTWNIHVYYQLNKLFNDNISIGNEGELINVRPLRIGIIFYIL